MANSDKQNNLKYLEIVSKLENINKDLNEITKIKASSIYISKAYLILVEILKKIKNKT